MSHRRLGSFRYSFFAKASTPYARISFMCLSLPRCQQWSQTLGLCESRMGVVRKTFGSRDDGISFEVHASKLVVRAEEFCCFIARSRPLRATDTFRYCQEKLFLMWNSAC